MTDLSERIDSLQTELDDLTSGADFLAGVAGDKAAEDIHLATQEVEVALINLKIERDGPTEEFPADWAFSDTDGLDI